MYKLEELQITDFAGIEDAAIEFTKPVTLFVGGNNQGKSSVKDAIRFAFTGLARNVSKVKDVRQLAYDGKEKPKLCVKLAVGDDADGFSINRRPTNSSKGTDVYSAMLPYCIDPAAFLRLTVAQRGAILADVLGGTSQALIEAAIGKHVGNIKPEILKRIKGMGIDRHNVDDFRNGVVEIRRELKRAENPGDMPKFTDYDLPDGFDVVKAKQEMAEIDAAEVALDKWATATANIQPTKHELARIATDISHREAMKKPTPAMCDKAAILEALEGAEKTVGESVRGQMCPTCGVKHDAALWEQRLAELHRQVTEARKAASKATAAIKVYDMATKELVSLRQRREEKTAYLAGLEEIQPIELPDGKDETAYTADLMARHEELHKQIEAYQRYRTATELWAERDQAAKANKVLIAECDRIDTALKDGGPVKEAIAAGGESLPLNPELLELWDLATLDLHNNGVIMLKGRPVEAASASEQYRTAAAIGLALAELCDIGFCCLDGFEVLVGPNANGFFTAVGERLQNVLIFGSRADSGIEAIRALDAESYSDHMEIYTVTEGVVERVE